VISIHGQWNTKELLLLYCKASWHLSKARDFEYQFSLTRTHKYGQDASVETPHLPSRSDLMERVSAFKIHVSPERIRQIERETKDQSQSALWYSARRY
jgi:hypothetical protein